MINLQDQIQTHPLVIGPAAASGAQREEASKVKIEIFADLVDGSQRW
jgi:hypothetical protein